MPIWLKFVLFGVVPAILVGRHVLKVIRTGVAPWDFLIFSGEIYRSERPVRFWIEVYGCLVIVIGWLLFVAYLLYWFVPQLWVKL
jgi:hypothetical protein